MKTIEEYAGEYMASLGSLLEEVQVTAGEAELPFHRGISEFAAWIREMRDTRGKLMFIGNGASAAISSHQAADFIRAAGIRACAFNDAPLLTCLGNDYGYEHTFDTPIGLLGDPQDLLCSISSSGASPNILQGTEKGQEIGCKIVTLSGFKPDNPLRSMGALNFYVPSESYGKVEVIHLAVLHCLCDYLAGR